MKIRVQVGTWSRPKHTAVEVVERFSLKIGERTFWFAVHRAVDNPSRFVASEWESGMLITESSCENPTWAKTAAATRLKTAATNTSEANVIMKLDTAAFDMYLNGPEGYVEEEEL